MEVLRKVKALRRRPEKLVEDSLSSDLGAIHLHHPSFYGHAHLGGKGGKTNGQSANEKVHPYFVSYEDLGVFSLSMLKTSNTTLATPPPYQNPPSVSSSYAQSNNMYKSKHSSESHLLHSATPPSVKTATPPSSSYNKQPMSKIQSEPSLILGNCVMKPPPSPLNTPTELGGVVRQKLTSQMQMLKNSSVNLPKIKMNMRKKTPNEVFRSNSFRFEKYQDQEGKDDEWMMVTGNGKGNKEDLFKHNQVRQSFKFGHKY